MLKVIQKSAYSSCVFVSLVLSSLTFLSGSILSSSIALADDSVVDEISITVPISCTMSGTGINSHTATLVNGTYMPNIGTTTLHAFCNDSEGFAIYAAGYTGNDIGQTNSNKLVGTSASNNATIDTGIATSAGNPDISNWAMKLTTTQDSGDTSGANAFTIDSAPNTSGGTNASFSQYHVVPNEYTKVAHKNSATDMTASTGGVKLTTTYAAYISKTQVADTYTGQVKYVLVHPSSAEAPVEDDEVRINFHGNGLYFDQAGTKSTNTVVIKRSQTDTYITVGDEYEISKTSNMNNNGEATSGFSNNTSESDTVTINGADMLKVVVSYLIEGGYDERSIFSIDDSFEVFSGSGTDRVVYVNGDTAYFNYDMGFEEYEGEEQCDDEGDESSGTCYWAVPPVYYNNNNEYGYFAKVYPVYFADADDEGAELYNTSYSYDTVIGTYAETTTWHGKWHGEIPYEYEDCYWDDDLEEDICQMVSGTDLLYFEDEDEIIDYMSNSESLLGTTINLYAYNPYRILYNGNGATAGTMSGFYTTLTDNTALSTADLMAYNFKKTGYGFAGWSADQNAPVNGNSKIYGPNERIAGNELTFNNNREATLYAVWVPSAGNLQGWSGCSSMITGQVTALTDTRDNNVYAVGKLADGNCWMMENLRLDAANSSDSTKAQGFGGVFTGLAGSEDSGFWFDNTTANSKYSTSNIIGDNQDKRFPRYNNNNANIGGTNSAGVTLTVSPGVWDSTHWDDDQYDEGNNNHSQWYGYGNYYSWAAAMANTAEMNDTSASESANTSICPVGWQLPYGDNTGNGASSGGFSYLDIQLGNTGSFQYDREYEENVTNKWRKYPNNFVYSGHAFDDYMSERGGSGYYWSATAAADHVAYSLYLNGGSHFIYPGENVDYKNFGNTIRCITLGV